MIFYKVKTYSRGSEPEPIEKVNLKNKRDVYSALNEAALYDAGNFEGESAIKYFLTKAAAVKHYEWLQLLSV